SNVTAQLRIDQINVCLSAHKCIVSRRGNRHIPMLYLCSVRVGIVEELRTIQTLQPHVRDVGHSVVCVECLFETQIGFAGVSAGELQGKLGAKNYAMHKTKLPRPPAPSLLVALN